ncbi:MAG: DUF2281 domain-containing protein [Candidatus Kapaibacterium sp.]|nr:MAG: DUF2281 domain-containing protein [Candidatus Kapabacteria bacterium]
MNTSALYASEALVNTLQTLTPAQLQEVAAFVEALARKNAQSPKRVIQLAGIWANTAWTDMDIEAELKEARREIGAGVFLLAK